MEKNTWSVVDLAQHKRNMKIVDWLQMVQRDTSV